MCCGGGPPYGIPIPEEIHERYSDELKAAWTKFDSWFQNARDESDFDEPIDRSTMPDDVKAAMDLIKKTPIPGFESEGYTGADSCYMIGVEMFLTDPEEK